MSPTTLGPLVRLWGLRTEQLPPASASAEELSPLLAAILREAVPFIDSAAPKDGKADPAVWRAKGAHAHADAEAKVGVLERVVPAAELERVAARDGRGGDKVRPETWCCRVSRHADAPRKGTASWAEFERCFRLEHAASEKAFTPACLAARQATAWDCAGVEAVGAGGVVWTGFRLAALEMRHRVGRPLLRDRTFPVLQMTASAAGGGDEFVVVSIPVPDFGARAKESTLASERGAQVAFYVSVERIRRGADGTVEWLMATASDAGGALPAWVQNLAAPGVIWKDVPLFLGWIARERGKRAAESNDAEGVSSAKA
ncbi:hypothetical protein F4804DRAFT_346701 [Jackrogersella minutella]|nr:hypothetical protein F4804DRAFT_346701 [Jackrogersella minutella]